MASRLDRLVKLLETGSTQLIRNTAAQQLGDVQKAHSDELFNLLARIVPYLRHRSWDVRTAAAKALGCIVENTNSFEPNGDDEDTVKNEIKYDGDSAHHGSPQNARDEQLLQLDTLDIPAVIANGIKLVASGSREEDDLIASQDPATQLEFKRRSAFSRLGLRGPRVPEQISGIIKDMDIKPGSVEIRKSLPSMPKHIASEDAILEEDELQSPAAFSATSPSSNHAQLGGDQAGLSKRQLNQLKRKQKLDAKSNASKVRVVDLASRRPSVNAPSTPASEPFGMKSGVKSEPDEDEKDDMFSLKRSNVDESATIIADYKGLKNIAPEKSMIETASEEIGLEWPFERLCEVMVADLLDPAWEIRHGAAMGLREVVRVHGAGAGRASGKTKHENDDLNSAWADDLACRLCCVLILDRFGDYISDNVVAPIRETIGQTLGALMVHLTPLKVRSIYTVLYRMVMQTDVDVPNRIWEICHGGMTGLRYLVAVRSDLLDRESKLMDGVVEAVMKGLADYDDDVRAVSAATLTPIAKQFVDLRPHALPNLVHIVWGCLSDLRDDLSASTGFVMDLLAKLCSFPEVLDAMQQNATEDEEQSFAQLVPRLYPFLRHTITTVRLAVLRALQTFLQIKSDVTSGWASGRTLRLVYQNLLVERNDLNLKMSLDVFKTLIDSLASSGILNDALAQHGEDMLALALHPIGTSRNPLPMDLYRLMRPSGQLYGPPPPSELQKTNGEPLMKKRKRSDRKDEETASASHNVDGHMISGEVDLVSPETLIRSRIYAAKALGGLLSRSSAGEDPYGLFKGLTEDLKSPYSSTQMSAGFLLEEYARASSPNPDTTSDMIQYLSDILETDRPENYADILPYLKIVRSQCQNLLNAFRDNGHVQPAKLPALAVVVQGDVGAGPNAFSVANAESLVSTDFDRLKKSLTPANRITSTKLLGDAQTAAKEAIEEAKDVKAERDMRIKAAVASAIVAIGEIPRKPSVLIKSIMDSIKMEQNVDLQKRSAYSIALLLGHYATAQKRGPADKITSNLTSFYCMDTSETPEYEVNSAKLDVILSLHKEEDRKDYTSTELYEKEARAARITRRGTKEALDQLSSLFGPDLFTKAPVLKSKIADPLHRALGDADCMDIDEQKNNVGQDIVDALSVLRTLTPSLDGQLKPFIISMMPLIVKALRHKLSVFRYAAAKCFATICSTLKIEGMTMLVEQVLPYASSDNLHFRQGVIEVVYHLIHVMEDNILPYVIFLLVPVLGRMSDSDNDIRLIATTTFATLVKLVPLEAGIPDPPGFSENLLKGRDRERKFIAQMLDFKKVEPFDVPVAIKAELRSYQQEGVNWLAFLNRYHLHGILCDDMGLGKTLQTLCIVASDHHIRAEEYAKTQASDARRLPSLIVCPPTLSGHWQQEILQFAPFLSCLAYVGSSQDRAQLRSRLGKTDIVVTSYDICRNEIDLFAPMDWNYCVLDEGHLIKNPKAKTSMAVKRIKSVHRLILSGTPIQNNVLELWSLFDFLMPGFLGTEKVFLDRFAKPIAASRYAKSSSKEQEAGALAIEALHKQVLPFLLRRLKEEVLADLPPKIIQNYYCDLSDLQKQLFDDFAKKERKTIAAEAGSDSKEAKQHIFQALQYMRKLCNSPSLVVKETHPQYSSIQGALAKRNTSLKDVANAPKLSALRDLLVDCGIGSDSSTNTSFVSPHRALIFCQMKEMLDIVANSVLRELLPSVQYLRLDGSVEANKRQSIVNQFNTDPSYDCLLLTTSVGGLGLNLTGADTVIFVEHDWNPQKDMQAMDRAHRIGQKKVVNVYRLVTRGTLEEKILNLQRFKIDVASTVVNQQNAGLATMETDQILDLFNISTSDPSSAAGLPPPPSSNGVDKEKQGREEEMVDATTGQVKEKGKKGWLDDLGELWDEKGYEEEFDLGGFLKTMKM